MATIRKSGNKWVAEIRRKDFYKSKTHPTKKQAKEWATRLESEYDLGKRGQIKTVKTLGDAIEKYTTEVSPQKKGSKKEKIRGEHFKRFKIYNVLLSDLDETHVIEFRDSRLKQGRSPGTVIREMGFLSSIVSLAIKEWKWLETNVFKQVDRPPAPKPRDRRIDDDEIKLILSNLGFIEGQPITQKRHEVAALFLLAIETAMRTSEMTTLELSQIDIEGRCITLLESKNGDSREVPLSKRAIEILNLLMGRDNTNLCLVTSSVVDATFRKARDKAKIKNLRFHDTRREATSRLAKKLDVLDLAKMTGHRDIKMLLQVYYKPKAKEIASLLD